MPGTAQIVVAVRFGGRLGGRSITVALAPGATVAELLAALAAQTGRGERDLGAAAVSLDGSIVGRAHVLHDGDAVALVLPAAGG